MRLAGLMPCLGLLLVAGCRDVPVAVQSQDEEPTVAQPPPTVVNPDATITAADLLNDPLTTLLIAQLGVAIQTTGGGPMMSVTGSPASADSADAIVLQAALDIILDAVELLLLESSAGG